MIPINNSDTAWLIVTDYNQDNNLPYIDLREDVLNPEINDWMFHYHDFSAPIGGDNTNGAEQVGFNVGYPEDELNNTSLPALGGEVGWALCNEGQNVGGGGAIRWIGSH